MKEIRYKDITKIDKYWLFYQDAEAGARHVDLSACANTFEKTVGGCEDALRCVGYRYREGGAMCYELFTIGHLQIRCKAGLLDKLLHKDSDPLMKLEAQLNAGGWKTIEK